jgi:hypothetical protein
MPIRTSITLVAAFLGFTAVAEASGGMGPPPMMDSTHYHGRRRLTHAPLCAGLCSRAAQPKTHRRPFLSQREAF